MSDIEAALEWPPVVRVPRHFRHTVIKARDRFESYYVSGRREELTNWQKVLTDIIHDRRFNYATPIFRAGILYRYAVSLQWRGVLLEYTHDFREAEAYWLKVIELTPEWSALSLRSSYNIALGMTNAYRASGDVALLDQAVTIMDNCTTKCESGSPEAALCWEGLSWALERRYVVLGREADISLSVKAAERSVREMPASSPRAIRYVGRFASVLQRKFAVFGDIGDINHSIELYAHLWDGSFAGNVDLVGYLGEASTAYRMRYELTHQIDDIIKAAQITKARLEGMTPGSGNYETTLNSYGMTLRHLFEARGESTDIDMAIRCHRKATNAVSESHQHYPGNVSNLGNALMARYLAYHDERDLDDAIEAHWSAVRASKFHHNIEVVNRQYNLASALLLKHFNTKSLEARKKIDQLFEEASERGLKTVPLTALRAAIARGRWHESELRFEDAAQAYDCAIKAVQQLFRQQNLSQDKVIRIRQMGSLPSSAAYCYARSGGNIQAALAIEQGRALLLTDFLEKKGVELNALTEAGHGDLVEAYRAAALRLDTATRRTVQAS